MSHWALLTFCVEENEPSIKSFKTHQEQSFAAEHDRWVAEGLDVFEAEEVTAPALSDFEVPDGCVSVVADVAGALYRRRVN